VPDLGNFLKRANPAARYRIDLNLTN